MIKNKIKTVLTLILAFSIIAMGINAYAHSGRTDSNGGHKDNKNASGLGPYHYHCGGYPAHLHTNGVCPYSSSSSSSTSSKSTKSNSSSTTSKKSTTSNSSNTTTKKTTTVAVKDIEINEDIESMEVGDSESLTATITPSNATDKKVTWKSSDEDIVKISSSGKITAKEAGTVKITATSSNGKTSTIEIKVKEEPKQEEKESVKVTTNNEENKTNTIVTNNNETTNNSTETNGEDSSAGGGIIAILLGYLGYRKFKGK